MPSLSSESGRGTKIISVRVTEKRARRGCCSSTCGCSAAFAVLGESSACSLCPGSFKRRSATGGRARGSQKTDDRTSATAGVLEASGRDDADSRPKRGVTYRGTVVEDHRQTKRNRAADP